MAAALAQTADPVYDGQGWQGYGPPAMELAADMMAAEGGANLGNGYGQGSASASQSTGSHQVSQLHADGLLPSACCLPSARVGPKLLPACCLPAACCACGALPHGASPQRFPTVQALDTTLPTLIEPAPFVGKAKTDSATFTFVRNYNKGIFKPYPKGDSDNKAQIATEIALFLAFIPWGLCFISADINVVIVHAMLLANRRCIGCTPATKAKVIMGTCYCDKHNHSHMTIQQQFELLYTRPFADKYIGIKPCST